MKGLVVIMKQLLPQMSTSACNWMSWFLHRAAHGLFNWLRWAPRECMLLESQAWKDTVGPNDDTSCSGEETKMLNSKEPCRGVSCLFSWYGGFLTHSFKARLDNEQWDESSSAHFPEFLLSQPPSWWSWRKSLRMIVWKDRFSKLVWTRLDSNPNFSCHSSRQRYILFFPPSHHFHFQLLQHCLCSLTSLLPTLFLIPSSD